MAADEIVISGFSAYFPQANHLKEFKEKLYGGVDMVTDDESRWPRGFLGLPARSGKIRDLTKCDVRLFTIHPEVHWRDPQVRLLLERSYEAIVDAGYDPATLRGRRIGVYIGVSASESTDVGLMNPDRRNGFVGMGPSRSVVSNLIAYALDFHGPCISVDTACSSTFMALHEAVLSLRSGVCDAAIVGGSNLTLNPSMALDYKRLGILSADGACKVFDAKADGYARSETVGVFFLQRASDARRIYAKVINVKTNTDGYNAEGVGTPSSIVQEQLLREVYSEAKIDPGDVGYVEAHGTGTVAGDVAEVTAISNFFGSPRRKGALNIGSVKSNVGHAEAASGICSLAKTILALETGTIAANLHFTEARPDIAALHDGRMEVVDKPTAITGGPIGINSFGFGGTNAHVILEANKGPHVESLPRDKPELPRLVLMAGRSKDSLTSTLNNLEAEGPYPDSGYCLLNMVGQPSLDQFRYRGYAIVSVDGSGKEAIKKVDQAPFDKRPLWFAFAGMGCQWNGMARQMMQFDAFARTIYKSHEILKRVGVDLVDLLTGDLANHQTSVSQFVTVAAVQLALVDTLRELGIEPDGFVGHSAGEVVCAYADGCFSMEQTLMSAYWRGRCVDEGNLPKGAMAAVGIPWEETAKRCPEGVFPACHNADDSVTVSGDAEAVARFVRELENDNVFTRLLDNVHVPFHSPYVRAVAPALQTALETVILDPRPRSRRWISSSVPADRWEEPFAQMCCAEYYVNNLVSPVLFRQCLQFVPKDAILVEVAPHCILQAILKRAVGPSATCLGLMKRDADNATFFLAALGKLHTLGFNLDVSALYPPVSWPVPRGTPSIAHLVSWDHSDSYYVPGWQDFASTAQRTEEVVEVDLEANKEDEYLLGHVMHGHLVFPASGYMVMAWKSLARRCGRPFEETSVQFDDLVFHRPIVLPESGPLRFLVNVMHSSGEFDVCVGGEVAATGRVCLAEDSGRLADTESVIPFAETVTYDLEAEDIYKEALLRGYEYRGAFRGVLKASTQKPYGKLKWEGNWVTFLDSMFHLTLPTLPHRAMLLPFKIDSCRVDTKLHMNLTQNSGSEGVDAVYWKLSRKYRAGGVHTRGVVFCVVNNDWATQDAPDLEEYKFVPFFDDHDAVCEREKRVREYVEVCSALTKRVLESCSNNENAGDVLSGVNIAPEQVLNRYLDKPADNQGLLQVLVAIRERTKLSACSLSNTVQGVVSAHKKLLEEDFLSTALFEEDSLRHLLDVVLENTRSTKVRVLEVVGERSEYILAPRVNSFLHKSGFALTIEFVIGHSDPNFVLPADAPEGTKTVALDFIREHGNNDPQFDLIVSRVSSTEPLNIDEISEVMSSACKEGGFVLLSVRTSLTPAERFMYIAGKQTSHVQVPEDVERAFGAGGFISVGLKSNRLSTLMLLRKRSHGIDLSRQQVVRLNNTKFEWVQNIAQVARAHENGQSGEEVWLVPEDGSVSGVVGLMKCLQQENPGKHFRCVFDASLTKSAEVVNFSPTNGVYKDLMQRDLAINVYRDGQWGSFCFLSTPSGASSRSTTQFAFMRTQARGNFSSLAWYESPLGYALPANSASGGVLCSVYYAPVNVGDVINATGDIPQEENERTSLKCVEELGWEFSGRDPAGRRVMGCLPGTGLATVVAACPDLLWEVPEAWSLKEASTVPMAYSAAYFALLVRGNLQPGETLLVQSGGSDVAQAAISIALSMECCVFVVVDSSEERGFLRRRFPQLKNSHLLAPDDQLFEEHISSGTMGNGVDVLISLPSGRNPQAGLNCLASHSRVLHILAPGESQGAKFKAPTSVRYLNVHEVSFEGLLFSDDSRTKAQKRRVCELLREGILCGAVQPFEAVQFTSDEAEKAFHFTANRNLRKAVIEVRPEEPERNCVHASQLTVDAVTRTYFYAHKSYVIIGGLGGFGLELADWMVTRGCRRLLLTSRYGVRTGYQRLCLHRWKLMGATAMVSTADVCTKDGAACVIREATALGPIGGIFNLAAVFSDASMENQTAETFEQVCKAKVFGTHYLDELSREMCIELDHFVVFSSVSCGRGNAGQTNYGFANSAMERICERRVADGLPGLAIQWGTVGDVGYAHDTYGADAAFRGLLPQRVVSCLAVMDAFLNQGKPVMSSVVKGSRPRNPKKKDEWDLVETIAEMLGVKDPSELHPSMTLGQLGLDSLMNVRVKQIIERHSGLSLSAQEIRVLTFNELHQISQTVIPNASLST